MINNNKLIFFIAAFDPTGYKLTRFLAANKKIQFMLNVLTTINYKVVLICSTPNLKVKNPIFPLLLELYTQPFKVTSSLTCSLTL